MCEKPGIYLILIGTRKEWVNQISGTCIKIKYMQQQKLHRYFSV